MRKVMSAKRKKEFVEVLAEFPTVVKAAKIFGVSPQTIRAERNRDPEFDDLCNDAIRHKLRDEVVRRAFYGETVVEVSNGHVVYADQDVVDPSTGEVIYREGDAIVRRERSDRCLLGALRALDGSFNPAAKVHLAGKDGEDLNSGVLVVPAPVTDWAEMARGQQEELKKDPLSENE